MTTQWDPSDAARRSHSQQQNRSSSHFQRHGQNSARSSQPSISSVPPISQATEAPLTGSASVSITPVQTAAREIPGFYFDPEKKKYFRITENHVLGNQHPFSRQSIKEKLQPKPVLEPVKRRRGPRFPSATTHYGSLDWFLQDRQLGLVGNPRRQLCEMHALLVSRWRRNKHLEPVLAENGAKYKYLQVDPISRDLYLGTAQGELWQYHISDEPLNTQYQWMQLDAGVSSEMTSFHITPDNNLITTYLGSMGRSGMIKIQKNLQDSSRHPITDTYHHSLTAIYEYSPSSTKSNFWTSAFCKNDLVVGADQKAIVIPNWRSGVRKEISLWTGSDVFSVAIEPLAGQSVVYAGCRNGTVRVFDLKEPSGFTTLGPKKRARSNTLFQGIGHKDSSVNCIRRVSEHYLVTAATSGEVSMWDTRFVGGSMMNSQSSSRTAKPVLDIRGFVSDQFSNTMFDINTEETLLATSHINQQVSLWSLSTGDRVKDLDVAGPVGCIQFAGVEQQGLWAAVGDCVQRWGIW
ncbi:DDB1 and CUL4 associated factor 4-like 2 [Mortierella sp. GBA30]|nr:DDB1 and CUL4 associated factor 4-like 2 [Mortierella sp. GBA30]